VAGRGSLVLVGGGAGIGKTALAEALCREATEKGALVLVGRCFDLTETPPYGPWIELFARYSQDAAMPPLPAAFATRGTVGEVASQAALFQQALDFFGVVSEHRPVVVLLEDLHWADPASLDLLRVVARDLTAHPRLLIITYRSDESTRRNALTALVPLLVREANADRLMLRPLDAPDVHALVEVRYRLQPEAATRLTAYLDRHAEGNPFFLGELLRSLEEEGVLRHTEAGWSLGALTGVQIPPLLRQVIDSRLARLGDKAQALLAVAAVIGQEIDLPIWATVAQTDAEALLAVSEQALAAHILEPSAAGSGLAISHALVRAALYEGILPPRRQVYHLRLAEALAAQGQPDPDAVAYHFQQARDARAVAWLIKAGKRAHLAWAWRMAKERYEAALAGMNGADPAERGALFYRLATLMMYVDASQAIAHLVEAHRLAVTAQDAALTGNILLSRGELRYMTGDVRGGLSEIARAVEELDTVTPEEQAQLLRREIIDAVDADGAAGVHLLCLAGSGRYDEAGALGEQRRMLASPTAARASAGRLSGYGHWGMVMTYAALGQPAEAEQEYRLARSALVAEGIPLYVGINAMDALQYIALPYHADEPMQQEFLAAEAEDAFGAAGESDVLLPARRGWLPVLVVEGKWDEARALAEAVLTGGGQGHHIASARHELIPLAYYQGDDTRAWQLIRELLPHGAESAPDDTPWYQSALTMQRTAVLLSLDASDLPTARTWLAAHDRWLAWSGTVLGRSTGQALWAHYYRQAGDIAQATAHATRALTLARDPRQPLALIAADRVLGVLATDAGRFAEGADHLDRALALADACAAPYERALTLLAMAELRIATDERVEALHLLDAVRALCAPLGAQPTLRRVEALTARLTTAESRAPVYPAGLSAREVEVLRLLAAGQTNREIADALFLSIPTINTHVAHILTKTKTENRAAAAAFAQRYGLV
jgi:DNA-binding CsgD family transcriptional regulator